MFNFLYIEIKREGYRLYYFVCTYMLHLYYNYTPRANSHSSVTEIVFSQTQKCAMLSPIPIPIWRRWTSHTRTRPGKASFSKIYPQKRVIATTRLTLRVFDRKHQIQFSAFEKERITEKVKFLFKSSFVLNI